MFSGTYTAIITPFSSDGSIDYDKLRELIDIQLFGLSIIELMLDYADQIQKSDDPVDIAMRSGDISIREMYLDYLLVTLEIQKDMSPYKRKDMERMTDNVSKSIEQNKEWMNGNAKAKIKQALLLTIDNASSDYIKEKYSVLIESL